MTNGDMIRAMSNEELADFIGARITACGMCPARRRCANDTDDDCNDQIAYWLNQTAEEKNDERN